MIPLYYSSGFQSFSASRGHHLFKELSGAGCTLSPRISPFSFVCAFFVLGFSFFIRALVLGWVILTGWVYEMCRSISMSRVGEMGRWWAKLGYKARAAGGRVNSFLDLVRISDLIGVGV